MSDGVLPDSIAGAVLKTGFEFEAQLAAALDREWAQVLSTDGEDGEFPVAEAGDDAMNEDVAESDGAMDAETFKQSGTEAANTARPPVASPPPAVPGGSQQRPQAAAAAATESTQPSASELRKQHARDAKRARRSAKRQREKQERDKTEYVHRQSQSEKFARGKRLRANRFAVETLPTTSNGFVGMNQSTSDSVKTADELLEGGIRLQKWDGV